MSSQLRNSLSGPRCAQTALVSGALAYAVLIAPCSRAAQPRIESDGTIHVSHFDFPESSYLTDQTRAALRRSREAPKEVTAKLKPCPLDAPVAQIPTIRKCQAEAFYKTGPYRDMRQRYAVNVEIVHMGGVYTEVFTPSTGVAPKNSKRVLINVHGGGYIGGRFFSHLESVPIAAVGHIKVISIDYRMAPEHVFPAASEDVASVYRELLKTYKSENIGFYGCSSGATLVVQSVAWFLKEKLPTPGAIGLFCAGAPRVTAEGRRQWVRSDSAYLVGALSGQSFEQEAEPYYSGVDRRSPVASPANYDEVMAKFPPTVLISGTRDFRLSETLITHAQLTRLGVEADLHVWEGMGHAFQFDPELPESREAYEVTVRFFDRHLGQ